MTAVIGRATSSLATVRSEASTATNGTPCPESRKPPAAAAAARPVLSVSKPSWVVRTESNVRKESIAKADPPCVVCRGSGRIDCHLCKGTGRTNHVQLTMLPKGEWPKWCRSCRGSGLGYCSRCLGTGEYRYIMGFQFMKREEADDPVQDNQRVSQEGSHSFKQILLNDGHSFSDSVVKNQNQNL